MSRWLKRLFCFHHWTGPYTGWVSFRLGYDVWKCAKCGKKVNKPPDWMPINYDEASE